MTRLTVLLTALAFGSTANICIAEPPLPEGAAMRLGDARFWAGQSVEWVRFTPDGEKLVCLGDFTFWPPTISRLSLWGVPDGREIRVWPSSNARCVKRMEWAADGNCWLVLTKDDYSLGPIDFAVRKVSLDTLRVPERPARAESGEAVQGREPPEFRDFAISPDRKWLAAERHADPRADSDIAVWELRLTESGKQWKPAATLAMPDVDILGFTADGRSLVGVHWEEKADYLALGIWDWKGKAGWRVLEQLNPEPVWSESFAMSADANSVALGFDDGTVHIHDLVGGRKGRRFGDPTRPRADGRFVTEVRAVAFSRDGNRLISAGHDATLRVWDVSSGKQLLKPGKFAGHRVRGIVPSPDGRLVATSGSGRVRLWDADTFEAVVPSEGHTDEIRYLGTTPDGRSVLTSARDHSAHLWDLSTGRRVRTFEIVESDAPGVLSPDGRTVVGIHDFSVVAWDAHSGQPRRLPASMAEVKARAAHFSARGDRLVTVGRDTASVWMWPGGKLVRDIQVSGILQDAILSPDGRDLILQTSADRATEVWDVTTGKRRHQFERFGDIGRYLTAFPAGSRKVVLVFGNRAEVWDLDSLREVLQFDRAEPDSELDPHISAMAASQDGTMLAIGSENGTIRLMEFNTGKEIRRFAGHRGKVTCLAFTPDHRRLISGGSDAAVFVWDLR